MIKNLKHSNTTEVMFVPALFPSPPAVLRQARSFAPRVTPSPSFSFLSLSSSTSPLSVSFFSFSSPSFCPEPSASPLEPFLAAALKNQSRCYKAKDNRQRAATFQGRPHLKCCRSVGPCRDKVTFYLMAAACFRALRFCPYRTSSSSIVMVASSCSKAASSVSTEDKISKLWSSPQSTIV